MKEDGGQRLPVVAFVVLDRPTHLLVTAAQEAPAKLHIEAEPGVFRGVGERVFGEGRRERRDNDPEDCPSFARFLRQGFPSSGSDCSFNGEQFT